MWLKSIPCIKETVVWTEDGSVCTDLNICNSHMSFFLLLCIIIHSPFDTMSNVPQNKKFQPNCTNCHIQLIIWNLIHFKSNRLYKKLLWRNSNPFIFQPHLPTPQQPRTNVQFARKRCLIPSNLCYGFGTCYEMSPSIVYASRICPCILNWFCWIKFCGHICW